MISFAKGRGKDGERIHTTEGNTMSTLDHPLAQSLLDLDSLDLLNHLRPEPLVLLLILNTSELSSASARTTKGLLRDGIERTFDGLRDGVFVS